jgi:uncharacterized protein YjbI with pentapeptide repeats
MQIFFTSADRWLWASWVLLVAGGVTLLGLAVLGIATVKANVLPRWAAVMFACGLPLGIAITLLAVYLFPDAGSTPLVAFYVGLGIFVTGSVRLGHALWARARLMRKLSQRLPELSLQPSLRGRVPVPGFGDKTIWDWLQLLIVPIMLAIASFWFTVQQDARQERIEEQRAQDAALQAYLDKIGELMLREDTPLRESEEGDEVNTLARSRTLTVLSRLDGERKAHVVLFLYESRLINKDRPDVDLRGADLSDVSLSGADLSGADLSGADLVNADLSEANLRDAFLSAAGLTYADLRGANLRSARLGKADLSQVQLSNADLDNASLYDANLRFATGATTRQLEQAESLDGATMPDGSIHP